MRAAAIIPARMAATRLPGKPLLKAWGKYIVQHVYEGVAACKALSDVLVATDDPAVVEAAGSFGARAVLTSPDHACGTDRVEEAAAMLSPQPDLVINVQGDEPGIGPEEIETLIRLMREKPQAQLSTLAVECPPEAGSNPARVKVVTDSEGFALYFSRSPVPFYRNVAAPGYLVHVGVYCFRRDALRRFVALPRSGLEIAESLEQLRALEAGMKIAVGRAARAPCPIDTPSDFEAFAGSPAMGAGAIANQERPLS